MKNLWPEVFQENTKLSAKSLLEEQAKLLGKITGGIVFSEVTAMSALDAALESIKGEFVYRFDIMGKFLENYRFNVLCFSHDITLYPVKFRLDEKIAKELGIGSKYDRTHNIGSEEELEKFISSVLTSERVKDVVGSIMRLSK